jgi:hypothetical protein
MDYRSNNILPFTYVFPTFTLTSGQSLVQTLQMQQSAQFELHEIFGSCTADADADVMPNNFSVLFTDQSTAMQMSNVRIPQRILCAPANQNYREVRPVIFAPGANIQADVLDLSAGNNVVTIAWRGYLILGSLQ